MHVSDLIRWRWLDYEPPSLCHDFGIGEGLAAITAAASSAAASAGAAVGTAATAAGSALGLGSAAAAGGGMAALTGAGDLAALTTPAIGALTGADALAAASAPAAAASFSLPSLATVGAITSLAGTGIAAKAGLNNAQYQSEVQTADAQALTAKANQDAASGEQTAITRQRQTQLALSRGQAVAAGSGGGADVPGVVDVEQQVAQQGAGNALSSIYQGQAAGRADQYQSGIDLANAQNISQAAPVAASATILSGLSSFVNNRMRIRAFTSTGQLPLEGF